MMSRTSWPWRAGRFATYGLVALVATRPAWAIQASPYPVVVQQPNGQELMLFLRGDERRHFYVYFHNDQPYSVLTRPKRPAAAAGVPAAPGQGPAEGARNDEGGYCFAALDARGELVPTDLMVGVDDPARANVAPRTFPAAPPPRPPGAVNAAAPGTVAPKTPAVGEIPNLVVLMRFADHAKSHRPVPPRETYEIIFNATGGHPQLAPTGSVRDVYLENSYGKMKLNSTVVGWVDLPQTEAYYADNYKGWTAQFYEALRAALEKVDANLDFKKFDSNGDGWIDTIAFIHSGYGAEWGGKDQDGASLLNRIWSHQSDMDTPWESKEGVKVAKYHVSTGFWGLRGPEPTHIGVVAHETGHFFGLPDLYDYSEQGAGAGSWCMMANSWGFDGTQLYPPHFCAWSKTRLKWIDPPELKTAQVVTLAAAETTAAAYKIAGYGSADEYLLVENRQPIGFDRKIPLGPGGYGGLAVWHVDETLDKNNTPGYPGQTGWAESWPDNGQHYKVALLQADGRYDLEQRGRLSPLESLLHGSGDGGDLFCAGHVRLIGPSTTPSTDGYLGGKVARVGHQISQVSYSGPTMTFQFNPVGPIAVAGPVAGGRPPEGPSALGAEPPKGPTLVPQPSARASVALAKAVGVSISAQFSYREKRAVDVDSDLVSLPIHLDQPMEVYIDANTSMASDMPIELAIGLTDQEDVSKIWSESLRQVSLPKAMQWVNVGTRYVTQLPAGDHTIRWRVWITGATVTFGSGTMTVRGLPLALDSAAPPVPTDGPSEPGGTSSPPPATFETVIDAAGRSVTTIRRPNPR